MHIKSDKNRLSRRKNFRLNVSVDLGFFTLYATLGVTLCVSILTLCVHSLNRLSLLQAGIRDALVLRTRACDAPQKIITAQTYAYRCGEIRGTVELPHFVYRAFDCQGYTIYEVA